MECKDTCGGRSINTTRSINRNIVECKASYWHIQNLSEYRINRNIVECKDKGRLQLYIVVCVLIETLWNVKHISMDYTDWQEGVLIETLWNVKLQQPDQAQLTLGY